MAFSSVLGASSVIKPGVVTTATRPSSPFVGQMIYDTTLSQVLVYNGSAWTITGSKIVAYTSNATTTITSAYLVGLNTTYTFESNKYYKISVATCYSITGGSGLILAIEVDGADKQRVFDNRPIAATAGNFNVNGFWVGTVAAGSKTVKLHWTVLSGSAVNAPGTDLPNQLIIEELGTL